MKTNALLLAFALMAAIAVAPATQAKTLVLNENSPVKQLDRHLEKSTAKDELPAGVDEEKSYKSGIAGLPVVIKGRENPDPATVQPIESTPSAMADILK